MKTRWFVSFSAAFVLLATVVVVTLAQPAQVTPFIPHTGPSEVLPSSIDDYTPAQRAQYQYTELPDPPAVPVTGNAEALPDSINDYTPAQRAQYQYTEPPEEFRASELIYLGAGYWMITGPDGEWIIPPFKSVVDPATLQESGDSIYPNYLGNGYWLVTGPDGGKIVQRSPK